MISLEELEKKCSFATSRSSGPGGQNVNKVETKVEVRLALSDIDFLTATEINRLRVKLKNRMIENQTIISITAQATRSQIKNKAAAVKRMHALIAEAIIVDPPRIATKPPRAVEEKRIATKKIEGDIKTFRGNLKNKSWE